jgi:hypothetical protein
VIDLLAAAFAGIIEYDDRGKKFASRCRRLKGDSAVRYLTGFRTYNRVQENSIISDKWVQQESWQAVIGMSMRNERPTLIELTLYEQPSFAKKFPVIR